MNNSLWNSCITRRYLSQLINDCDSYEYHFKNNSYPVTLMTTILSSEIELVERSTFGKIVEFWKELEKTKTVKHLSYLDFIKENNLDIEEPCDVYRFSNPYEEVLVDKETRVQVLDKKKLEKLYSNFISQTDLDPSLTSGLAHLTSKFALRFTSTGFFEYGGLRLKFKKDTRPYLVLASILKRTTSGGGFVSYEQIEDDVPKVVTERQMTYPPSKRRVARNKNISNSVAMIQKQIDLLAEKAYKRNDAVRGIGRVAISIVRGEGVQMTNAKLR